MTHWLCVLVQTPAYANLGVGLSYLSELPLPPGTLVRVPLGKREVLGVVWDADTAQATGEKTQAKSNRLRADWRALPP